MEAAMEKVIATTMEKLLNKDGDSEARKTVAKEMADSVKNLGVKALLAAIEKLKAASTDKKNNGAREGSAWGFEALAKAFEKKAASLLFPQIGVVTTLAADTPAIKVAAEAAANAIFATLDSNAVRYGSPFLFEAASMKNKWQSRVLALNLVSQFARVAPGQTTRAIPELIPALSAFMGDARAEVSKAAEDALLSSCNVVDNKDIEPFIPTLVSCIARPEEVSECVYKLSSTTFVQAVGPSTLAIITPVLERGLKERTLSVKRKVSCVHTPFVTRAPPAALYTHSLTSPFPRATPPSPRPPFLGGCHHRQHVQARGGARVCGTPPPQAPPWA